MPEPTKPTRVAPESPISQPATAEESANRLGRIFKVLKEGFEKIQNKFHGMGFITNQEKQIKIDKKIDHVSILLKQLDNISNRIEKLVSKDLILNPNEPGKMKLKKVKLATQLKDSRHDAQKLRFSLLEKEFNTKIFKNLNDAKKTEQLILKNLNDEDIVSFEGNINELEKGLLEVRTQIDEHLGNNKEKLISCVKEFKQFKIANKIIAATADQLIERLEIIINKNDLVEIFKEISLQGLPGLLFDQIKSNIPYERRETLGPKLELIKDKLSNILNNLSPITKDEIEKLITSTKSGIETAKSLNQEDGVKSLQNYLGELQELLALLAKQKK